MAENVILGFPSVEQFRDKDLIHRSLRRTIINAFPNGGAPLTALIAWANVDPIANTKHEWIEEIYRSPSITTRGTNPITTNAPTTGDANDGTVITAKTYTTADKLYIKATSVGLLTVGDVVRFHTWNALARITAVTPGVADNSVNGYVEVLPIRDFAVASGNLADYAAGTSIDVIGSAFEEGGHSGTPRGTRIPTFLQNQTQIFKEPFIFTGSAIKQDLEFDQSGPYKKRAMDAARDHYVKLEKFSYSFIADTIAKAFEIRIIFSAQLKKSFCTLCAFIAQVIYYNNLSAGLKYSLALFFKVICIKPMKSLSTSYIIHAFVGKTSVLRTACDRTEILAVRQLCFSLFSHISIWLHRIYKTALF